MVIKKHFVLVKIIQFRYLYLDFDLFVLFEKFILIGLFSEIFQFWIESIIFWLRDCPRVCITQIFRSSSVFVGVKINRKKKVQFYIDLLPKHNIWIRLEQDFEYDIWLCIRKEFRIYINFFIDTIYELFTKFTLKYRLYLKRYFLKKERLYSFFITYDQLINIKIFYFNCKTNKFNDKKIIIIYFIQKFSNPLSYNLVSICRKKINVGSYCLLH